MSIVQLLVLTVALSGPIAILIGVALAVLCFVRSRRAKSVRFALASALCALMVLTLLAVIIVVWFAYGVAHSGKDAATDLAVLAGTVIPAYIGVFGTWRFSVYLRKRLGSDVPVASTGKKINEDSK